MPPDMLRYSEIRRIAQAYRKATSDGHPVDFYWLQNARNITHVEGSKDPPRGAVFIGRYCYPCPSGDFIDDLNWLLASGVKP